MLKSKENLFYKKNKKVVKMYRVNLMQLGQKSRNVLWSNLLCLLEYQNHLFVHSKKGKKTFLIPISLQ